MTAARSLLITHSQAGTQNVHTWQIEERPLRRKFNYHQQDNCSSCNKMQCLCKQMCEQWFGCRNGAATESLICSVSSSSTLSSSSLIQRLLLFIVTSGSTSFSFSHSFPCLAKNTHQKLQHSLDNPPQCKTTLPCLPFFFHK